MPASSSTLDQQARQRILTWIRTTGMRQAELAERVGKTQAWLSRYLSGQLDADLRTLDLLARQFGHSLVALLDLPAEPKEAKLIEMYRALPADARMVADQLFQSWTRPYRPVGRSRK